MAQLAVFIIGILVMGAIAYMVINRNIKSSHNKENKKTDGDKQ